MPLPTKNIHWQAVPASVVIYDAGACYVAGSGDSAAVVFWEGREARAAQSYLRKVAKPAPK